jgi:hypothetical protein
MRHGQSIDLTTVRHETHVRLFYALENEVLLMVSELWG